MRSTVRFILPYLTGSLLLCFRCAHRQAPVGGPDDTRGPEVVSVSPTTESVNVPKSAVISITFSEWLLPSSGKGISIFPVLPLKTRVSGRRLEIRPGKALSDSTTYHLVITSALKDLRNNPMSKPLSITFSTGPTLDSGAVSGCVVDYSGKRLQHSVALFRAPWQDTDSGFGGPPSYMIQTDSSGRFFISHIKTGPYYLVAFNDKNGNGRLQSGSEEVFTTVDSTVTVTIHDSETILYPSAFDTSRQSITSLAAIDSRTITGSWKLPWDTVSYPRPPVFTLVPEDRDRALPPVSVRYLQYPASTRFLLISGSALDTASFLLLYSLTSIFDTVARVDTLHIRGAAEADTVNPFLSRSSHQGKIDLRPEIRLIWSEPVFMKDTLVLMDTLGDTVVFTGDTIAADTSLFTATRSLLPGREYRLILLTSHGNDLSGNPLRSRDSTDTAGIVSFSTVHADSIAISLQGCSPCLGRDARRQWFFKPLSGAFRTLTRFRPAKVRSVPLSILTVTSGRISADCFRSSHLSPSSCSTTRSKPVPDGMWKEFRFSPVIPAEEKHRMPQPTVPEFPDFDNNCSRPLHHT